MIFSAHPHQPVIPATLHLAILLYSLCRGCAGASLKVIGCFSRALKVWTTLLQPFEDPRLTLRNIQVIVFHSFCPRRFNENSLIESEFSPSCRAWSSCDTRWSSCHSLTSLTIIYYIYLLSLQIETIKECLTSRTIQFTCVWWIINISTVFKVLTVVTVNNCSWIFYTFLLCFNEY